MLRACFDEGVGNAVVVANGPNPSLAQVLAPYGERVMLIALSRNLGSAPGYARAIEAGLRGGYEHLWLMDDDNAPAPGTLARLLSVLGDGGEQERTAVAGYREDQQPDVRAGVPLPIVYPPRGSFLGFDARAIAFKLKRRWLGLRVGPRPSDAVVTVPYAEFGGLLAHRSLFAAIGLPAESLALYGDDHEYTYRITERGGTVRLVLDADIRDLERSWFVGNGKKRSNSFVRLLTDGSDVRVFYTLRNRAWFDRHRATGPRLVYAVNKALFSLALRHYARRHGTQERQELIRRAVRDGEARRLGPDPAFPLP